MRFPVKTWVPVVLGIALLVSLVGLSSGAGALAQSATSAATMSSGSTTGGSGSGASGTASAMTYPLCTPDSSSSSAMSTAMATQSMSMPATMMPTMMASQSATMSGSPGFLGISATTVDNCGILVAGLVTSGPAASANLQVGDVIVAVNGQSVTTINGMNNTGMGTGSATPSAAGMPSMTSVQPFATFIQSMQAGQTITLTIQRNGQQMDISVTLGTIPSGLMTGTPGSSGSGSTSGATMAPVASATVSQ